MNEASDFKLTFAIEQAFVEKSASGKTLRYVSGLASGTDLDLDGERMAHTAIAAFKKAIEEGIVTDKQERTLIPLLSGHRKEWDDHLGWVVSADIDNKNNLWITAELNDTSKAHDLYQQLTTPQQAGRPTQLGFSVGGRIQKASRQWDAELRRSVRVIEDVALKEVSVTSRPAYPTAYVEALSKSLNWDEVPLEEEEQEQNMTLSEKEVVTEEVTSITPEVEKEAEVVTTEEVVTKEQEEVVETDPVVTEEASDPLATITSKLSALEETVTTLVASLSSNKSKEEESDPTDVQKTEEVEDANVEEVVSKSITDAFKAFTDTVITPLADKVSVVADAVAELAAQPMDKSFSIGGSKEETDAVSQFVKKYQEANPADLSHANVIGDAVRLSRGATGRS